MPLAEAQEFLLARGPNFTVVQSYSSIREYATSEEEACQKLLQKVTEYLSLEVSRVLECACTSNEHHL